MTTEALEQAFAATREVLANVRPDQLDDPTPCASWKVRDVVNHLVAGSHWFASSVEAGKAPTVEETDYTAGDIVGTYDLGIKRTVAAFGAPGATEKMVELPFGTFPGAAFMNLVMTDTLTHGWDVAKATGQSTDLAPEVATQLLAGARVAIPDAFRGPDPTAPFGPEQPAPADASPADRLAAFLGRKV